MRKNLMIFGLFLSLTSMAGEWVVPWVANKTGEWSTKLIINNHQSTSAQLTLEAVRPDGNRQIIQGYGVPALGQVVLDIDQVFFELGSGTGYSVFIRSDHELLSAAARVISLRTASQDSPALGHAQLSKSASSRLVFPSIPIAEGTKAAVVLLNLSDQPIKANLEGFGTSGRISSQFQVTLPPRQPVALLADYIFPEATGSIYIVAKTDAPMLGASFNFNSLGEPSLINATDHPGWDTAKLSPLWQVLDTSQTASELYVGNAGTQKTSSKGQCPTIDLDLGLESGALNLHASFDWGNGCYSPWGVYREGAITMDLAFQTTFGQPTWASGALAFDQYGSAFLGAVYNLDGSIRTEGYANGDHVTLNGQWTAEGNWPGQTTGSHKAQVMINLNRDGNFLLGYGMYRVEVDHHRQYSVEATVNHDAPLTYQRTCPWPIAGMMAVRIQEGRTWQGTLQFETGNCRTAELTVNGVTEVIDLHD